MLLPRSIHTIPFNHPLPQNVLNIEDKNRSNFFTWRGQFSPQLIEDLLLSYCPRGSTILDPFSGSGTALYEAGCLGFSAYGTDINPSAWILSKVYQFINIDIKTRRYILNLTRQRIHSISPEPELFSKEAKNIDLDDLTKNLTYLKNICTTEEINLIEALIIMTDLHNNSLNSELLYMYFHKLSKLILSLPYSINSIQCCLADARSLPLSNGVIDFVITSPPYINVFNYHQNYRKSAEILGWNLLKIAKSEIGSNRANRSNRFITVVQYCLDMVMTLSELSRVCTNNAHLIFIVGHESNVLGVPFYNSTIIKNILSKTGVFSLEQTQKREFKNKFGKMIREDLLHFTFSGDVLRFEDIKAIGYTIARDELANGLEVVSEKNRKALQESLDKLNSISETPFFHLEAL